MEEIVVSTKQGTLKGTILSDLNGEKFYSFQGIPYAVPPLNELRFKAPLPLEKWSGVLDATKEANRSYSRDLFLNTIVGTEDCLYVNVYTRQVPPTQVVPVLFWVHGGAFIGGSGNPDVYGPHFLLTENLVLVTVNYRLGILGFLSLETPELEVPGNAGLKDIVLALKWVQTNIREFGGDPQNVTVAGGSSGGALLQLFTLSPICEGLFHKVVLQSGCAFTRWCYGTSGVEEIAKVLKMENKTEEEVYHRLVKLPVEEIFQIQEKIVTFRGVVGLKQKSFSFVVEKFNSGFTFLNRHPLEILTSGDFRALPHMVGYCSDEFMIFRRNRSVEVPWSCCPHKERISQLVRKFYFGEPLNELSTGNTVQLFSDINLILGLYIFIINFIKHSKPLYLYKLTLSTDLNFLKRVFKLNYPGASHYDEIGYLFKNFATPEVVPGSLEDAAIRRMVKLWGNFCKFGNPTPDSDPLVGVVWENVRENEFKCLEIGEELVVGDIGMDFERVKNLFKIMGMIQKERMYKAHF